MTAATTHTAGASRNGTTPSARPPSGARPSASHERELLDGSKISRAVMSRRGYWTAVSDDLMKQYGFGGVPFPALLIPIWDVHGQLAYHLARPDTPLPDPDRPGHDRKYLQPHNTRPVIDVHPSIRDKLADPSVPLDLTEGVKKADAAVSAGLVCVAIFGVWSWRGANRYGGLTALACWDAIALNNRRVRLVFDSDARHNRAVLYALTRLANYLESKGAVVEIVLLPDGPNGAKTGYDDYFVRGGQVSDLGRYVCDRDELAHRARPPLVDHPETGETLVLPAGYDWVEGAIARRNQRGGWSPVYSGTIYPAATGHDLSACEESVTIAWSSPAGAVTIPRAALTDARTFGALVGGAGAALHAGNTRGVTALLVETIVENSAALPRQIYASRLGLVGSGIVLPVGSIGFSEPIQYAGRPAIRVGADADAYPDALRLALEWPDTAALWLKLGLSLASPAIARLRPRRNPVLYDAGASGSGKTTTAQFAAGCYGDPTKAPYKIEAARTTIAGVLQTLDLLGGLPLFVDDAHMAVDLHKFEATLYSFANGQTYSKGSVDGKARGGTPLAGSLLLAGEATPELRHAGSQRRILFLDAGADHPLGAPPESDEGALRAAELERAWEAGAGLLGYAVTERIWGAWGQFTADVGALEAHPALEPLHAWRTPLAIGAAALSVALDAAAIVLPDRAAWLDGLLVQWAMMLMAGRRDHDPAIEAWSALMTMLAQGQHRHDGNGDLFDMSMTWEWIEERGNMIACRKAGDDYWRVPTGSPQVKERLGTSAAQLYGRAWIAQGWVREQDGAATTVLRVPNGPSVRALCVPCSVLSDWDEAKV